MKDFFYDLAEVSREAALFVASIMIVALSFAVAIGGCWLLIRGVMQIVNGGPQ